MDIISRIESIIEPSLTALGYQLVQVKFADGKRKTLSIMAERADGVTMSFDDCADITNNVSALLDVEDPISGAYNLEVCSPGLDRPLTRREDYKRFAGQEIKAETIIPVATAAGARKRFRGIVLGIEGDNVSLSTPEGEIAIPFSHIKSAKLAPEEFLPKNNKKPGSNQKKTKTKG